MSGTARASASLRASSRTSFAIAAVLAVAAIVVGVVSFVSVLDARRRLVDRADPAVTETVRLLSSLVDQETSVRAYVVTGDADFLGPYEEGRPAEARSITTLRQLVRDDGDARRSLEEVVTAADRWHAEYAQPTLDAVAAGDPAVAEDAALDRGRTLFDAIRSTTSRLEADLARTREVAKADLSHATTRMVVALVAASLVLVAVMAWMWVFVRRLVQRPLDTLRSDAAIVGTGDISHPITPVGPQELVELGTAMETMRSRIVTELDAVESARAELERRTADLTRSNSELEQFAYVASHDLQEPLRKVASFCQLLQSRYAAQLDERANQYIDFAVDGAKRMQALINDLLAFSRVGRLTSEMVEVPLDLAVRSALANLAAAVDDTGATIDVDPLPVVLGERALLVAVFQNLIGNAIKYRRPDTAPVVRVTVSTHADEESGELAEHEIVVRDNGIGIEPQYAERIFIIFQRLHSKEAYEGTGIGLALCRKIVEYHGGRIWAATDVDEGSAIHFTLPVLRSATDRHEA